MKNKLLIILSICTLFSCGSQDLLDLESVQKVTLEPNHRFEDKKIIISDKDQIKKIVSLINSGEKTKAHKCIALGLLTVQTKSEKIKIELLPGHEDGYYEFRANRKYYKISEKDFFEVSTFLKEKEKLTTFQEPHF